MRRLGVGLLFWWFLWLPGGRTAPAVVIGPFRSQEDCEGVKRLAVVSKSTSADPTHCWWDGR